MSEHGYASRTASASAKAGSNSSHGGAKDAPMSGSDHTKFVDLLLQQAAETAKDASIQMDPKALAEGAAHAIAKTRQALREYSIPAAGSGGTRLLRSVDAAFMGLFDLHDAVLDSNDPSAMGRAPELRAAMSELDERFEAVGWKRPTSAKAGHARASKAAAAGAAHVTMSEKGSLGRLHIRAARQHILGAWQDIVDGNVAHVSAAAAQNLRDAMALLVDPNLAGEMSAVGSELESTSAVLSRLFLYVANNNAAALAGLRELARAADALLQLAGKERAWEARLNNPGSASAQPAPATAPAAQAAPASGGPARAPVADNNADPGAPRADPAMHRLVESKTWTKKVHIKDTNLSDEYLGYIELFMVVNRTESGQVYAQVHRVNKHLLGRANEQLNMAADVAAYSLRENGENFTDIYFDVEIGTRGTTHTSGVTAAAKVAVGDPKEGGAGEVSVGGTFSSTTTSQGSRSFRRVYRISGVKPFHAFEFDGQNFKMKDVETGLVFVERKELRRDFSEWELDDDDVGDRWDTFYSNWILHSYGD